MESSGSLVDQRSAIYCLISAEELQGFFLFSFFQVSCVYRWGNQRLQFNLHTRSLTSLFYVKVYLFTFTEYKENK